MELCMCGAEDCPRCFPGHDRIEYQLRLLADEVFEAMADDETCYYCGGRIEKEHCLDDTCEGA